MVEPRTAPTERRVSERVLVFVPAEPVYSFAPCLVAAWVVASRGAPLERVEDARLAVDEVVTALIDRGCAVEANFEVDGGVTVEVTAVDGSCHARLSPIAERILAAVCEACGPTADGRGGYRLRLRAGATPGP